jgi:hypothetical protein
MMKKITLLVLNVALPHLHDLAPVTADGTEDRLALSTQ